MHISCRRQRKLLPSSTVPFRPLSFDNMSNEEEERKDWFEWHAPYDDPASALSLRLGVVKEQIRKALPTKADTPFKIVSLCSGQGRDIIEVLSERSRKMGQISARLVELDERNVAAARNLVKECGLTNVEIVHGDASFVDAYTGMVPADIILMCGILGNISSADITRTISEIPQLCAYGAVLIWTRHRRPPDQTTGIRQIFAESGFRELEFIAPANSLWCVGVERYNGKPKPLTPGLKLFTFISSKS